MKLANALWTVVVLMALAPYMMGTTYSTSRATSAANTYTADQTLNDNVNLTFGTGGDADIDYNATNLVIDPKVAGSGGLIISGIHASTQVTIDVDGGSGTEALAITSSSVNLTCTDAEVILTITGGLSGQLLAIAHEDSDCTLDDTDVDTANQMDLVGANGDLAGAADLMILLYFNGTSWHELIRSQN